MKKKQIILLSITMLIIAVVTSLFLIQNKSSSLKECPDEWVEDRMPGPEGDNSERQYFIFDGERKEVKNYDINWIKSNCSVQVHYVY